MSSSSDAFIAEAKSLNYTFRATAGTKPTWTPRWGFVTDEPRFDPRFKIGGQFGGWFYGVRAYGGHGQDVGEPEAKRGPDVNEFYSDHAGVLGTGVYVTGVAGTSIHQPGVYGQLGEEDSLSPFPKFGEKRLLAGVVGVSSYQTGVRGWSNYYGVWGEGINSAGVRGESRDGPGVEARANAWGSPAVSAYSQKGPGVLGYAAPPGPLGVPGVNTFPAVFGTSDQQIGVLGTSNALPGVYGFSTGNAGVVGQSANPNSFGGYFFGNVVVTGNLTVNGMISPNPKLAVVPFPDGTHRALYCMESPEVWFEDFGAARLKRGRAVVKLDADFGRVIKRGDYRVFFTPEGDCRGLYIRGKRAASFEVRELAGGKSNVAFTYRIVGRRKDIGRHTRFAKIDARLAKPNTRLPLPAAAAAAPRKQSKSSALRAFMAGLEKEARARAPKGVNKDPRPIPKHLLPQAIIAAKARARRKAKAGSGARQGTARKAPS